MGVFATAESQQFVANVVWLFNLSTALLNDEFSLPPDVEVFWSFVGC